MHPVEGSQSPKPGVLFLKRTFQMEYTMKTRGCLITLVVVVAIAGLALLFLSDIDFAKHPNRIGVIEIKSTITSSKDTLKQIKEFRKNNLVKVLLVRIDSPGGAIGPTQEIYREIRRTIETKPVLASLGSIAASGGYYIASGCSHVMCNPGTITGSIGVIMHFPYLRGLFDKIGYDMVTIKSGQFKDIGNPAREMTPEEKQLLQGTIDEAYGQFVHDVSQGRKIPEEEIRKFADGRIIMGQTALDLKLVDSIGNYEDAIDKAAALGKIEGEPNLVYGKKEGHPILDLLLGDEASEKVNEIISSESADFLRYQIPNFH